MDGFPGARRMIVNVIVDCSCNYDTLSSHDEHVRGDIAILAQVVQVWLQAKFLPTHPPRYPMG